MLLSLTHAVTNHQNDNHPVVFFLCLGSAQLYRRLRPLGYSLATASQRPKQQKQDVKSHVRNLSHVLVDLLLSEDTNDLMSVLDILKVGHPILRQPARALTLGEVGQPKWQTFIDDLIETMRHANGAGLAANQVGEPVQICVMEVDKNPRYPYKPQIPLTVLVNPVLTPLGNDTFLNYEGCLSVPNLRGVVSRFAKLKVEAVDRNGQGIHIETAGITAGTYQHEVDHLEGKLFLDRVRDTTTFCTWDHFKQYKETKFAESVKSIVAKYGS